MSGKQTSPTHTPGPWIVTTCCDYWVEPESAPDGDEFHGIAHCGDIDWPGYRDKQHEWEANARLISASPDFAAGVEQMLAYEQAGGDGWWKGWEMLKAAYRKAIGVPNG